MKIHIEALHFTCIIGILEHERQNEQKVIIDVAIEYDFEDNVFINYAEVAEFIKTDMQNKKYLLIEDALQDLSRALKNKFSKINTLYLKITKPSILPDCKVSVSNITNFQS
ncbi:dihydroneopterin aldolase [Sulfurimonas sediminis]|uniref:dihydroneopterin aldolase n=1 Tax=Sulfurimonas sediminis TaxID=2590020 RepID=A0A7M1B048_9BACT|nr:dihydroneopterin aldolase [Sulfurimonas sediminis]QOP43127.1 dihydroneopterin aldolase [Sulfurimonas sediminis]